MELFISINRNISDFERMYSYSLLFAHNSTLLSRNIHRHKFSTREDSSDVDGDGGVDVDGGGGGDGDSSAEDNQGYSERYESDSIAEQLVAETFRWKRVEFFCG